MSATTKSKAMRTMRRRQNRDAARTVQPKRRDGLRRRGGK